ncbi:hypothetical protein [Rhodococcus sp. BH5]|uniref:hypothetical protein n=1 Tax=Rhodococcus sp. BH5 TaxID=2871702 RepID=UPI0022CDA3CA|nr:hypothetical protein [Rhodococcus sp. BH5]MCZ9631352.1 hypothetical protein [Rhodococcus sp. BH5]
MTEYSADSVIPEEFPLARRLQASANKAGASLANFRIGSPPARPADPPMQALVNIIAELERRVIDLESKGGQD